jgi:hypothetical protein
LLKLAKAVGGGKKEGLRPEKNWAGYEEEKKEPQN